MFNLESPDVKRFLDKKEDERIRTAMADDPAYSKKERELVHLAGDMDSGLNSTISLSGGKHEVRVTYKDFVLTVDVYAIPGEPLQVHLICPKCRQQLRVTEDRKAIEFDPRDTRFQGGRISIEPFQCTWEMPEAGKHNPGLISGGMTLCKWTAGISNNVARDA